MRGGVSVELLNKTYITPSSPHAWGCFQRAEISVHRLTVFPTCVGVFLNQPVEMSAGSSLPHMRGGVSMTVPAFSA